MAKTKGQIRYIQENKLNFSVDARTRTFKQFLKKKGFVEEKYEV